MRILFPYGCVKREYSYNEVSIVILMCAISRTTILCLKYTDTVKFSIITLNNIAKQNIRNK